MTSYLLRNRNSLIAIRHSLFPLAVMPILYKDTI